MHTVTIEIPDELSGKEVSLSIAKQLFEKELVSAEQAAKLAEVNVEEFLANEIPKENAATRLEFKKPSKTAREVVDEQIKAQGYTGLNKKELDEIIARLDVQEPLELLLSQLTK